MSMDVTFWWELMLCTVQFQALF